MDIKVHYHSRPSGQTFTESNAKHLIWNYDNFSAANTTFQHPNATKWFLPKRC